MDEADVERESYLSLGQIQIERVDFIGAQISNEKPRAILRAPSMEQSDANISVNLSSR